jgi:hypothetical protein
MSTKGKWVWLVWLSVTLGLAACENKDRERGQFDNNGSGMDQDHTQHVPDTVEIPEQDTIKASTPDSTANQ